MQNRNSLLDTSELMEIARQLMPMERQLLQSLADKGPGLLIELAVRVLQFPEEIAKPMENLRERGLVRAESFNGGTLGGEVLSLTEQGRQVVRLLRHAANEPDLAQKLTYSHASPRSTAPDPRQQQVDLLRKLGDLAVQEGDTAKAQQFYEEALQVTRKLSASDS